MRLLAGDPAKAGRPGVPVVDDGGPGDEVVEAAALPLVDDAEEPDAEGENSVIASPMVRSTAWRRLIGPPSAVTTCKPKIAMPSVLPLTAHWYV